MSKEYLVKKVKGNSNGDFLKSDIWKEAVVLSDFNYPWEVDLAPPMTFQAYHDGEWLHCLYHVTDKDVRVYVNQNDKAEVIHGDRVEIFFRQDEKLNPYYCLEIDPLARVYDYCASYHRKFDATWSWPSGHLKVQAEQTEIGYSVYCMISLNSLKQLGLLKDSQLQVGVFRGKCVEVNLVNDNMKWISWVKPDSVSPDFHISSAFGVFKLG